MKVEAARPGFGHAELRVTSPRSQWRELGLVVLLWERAISVPQDMPWAPLLCSVFTQPSLFLPVLRAIVLNSVRCCPSKREYMVLCSNSQQQPGFSKISGKNNDTINALLQILIFWKKHTGWSGHGYMIISGIMGSERGIAIQRCWDTKKGFW